MPTKKTKIILVIGDDLINDIDEYRFNNWINSRSEAVRRLIQKGLESEKDKPADKSKD